MLKQTTFSAEMTIKIQSQSVRRDKEAALMKRRHKGGILQKIPIAVHNKPIFSSEIDTLAYSQSHKNLVPLILHNWGVLFAHPRFLARRPHQIGDKTYAAHSISAL